MSEEEMEDGTNDCVDSSELEKPFNNNTKKSLPLFREFDVKKPGLTVSEFISLVHQLDQTVPVGAIKALYRKMAMNFDKTIDLSQFLNFLSKTVQVPENSKWTKDIFPFNFELLPCYFRRSIVKVFVTPLNDETKFDFEKYGAREIRPYQDLLYTVVTSDGTVAVSSKDFTNPAFYKLGVIGVEDLHSKKYMGVHDMVFIEHLNEMVVSTCGKEVLFFRGSRDSNFRIKYAVLGEEVDSMDCWSSKKQAILILVTRGFMYVMISDIRGKTGFINSSSLVRTRLIKYPTVDLSSLMTTTGANFVCVKIPTFESTFAHIRYFPDINSCGVCSELSETMILIKFTYEGNILRNHKMIFKSSDTRRFFTCVEYSPWTNSLVTGCTDGFLVVWQLSKSSQKTLSGHKAPITHILYNSAEKVFVSISADKNLRIWTDCFWHCLQSFFINNTDTARLSTVFYNVYNNELLVGNKALAKCFGRGTDLFQNTSNSHSTPVCTASCEKIATAGLFERHKWTQNSPQIQTILMPRAKYDPISPKLKKRHIPRFIPMKKIDKGFNCLARNNRDTELLQKVDKLHSKAKQIQSELINKKNKLDGVLKWANQEEDGLPPEELDIEVKVEEFWKKYLLEHGKGRKMV